MALSLGGISAWTNENEQELFLLSLTGLDTLKAPITIMPNVTYKSQIKYLDTDALIFAGGCGFTASGTTSITKRDISVVDLKSQEEICLDELKDYALSQSLVAGFDQSDSNAVAKAYCNYKVGKLQESIESMIWSNSSASTTACAGWQSLMYNDSVVNDYVCAMTGYTTFTASDWLAYIFALQATLPEAIINAKDMCLFVSYPVFRKMLQVFVVADYFHFNVADNDGMTPFIIPSTNIKLVPVYGLGSSTTAVLTPASNMIFATDLKGEENKFKFWWSEDDQIFKFSWRARIGVYYKFSDYVAFMHV